MGGSLRVDGVLRVRPWTAGIASSKERHQRARAQPWEDQRDGRCLQALGLPAAGAETRRTQAVVLCHGHRGTLAPRPQRAQLCGQPGAPGGFGSHERRLRIGLSLLSLLCEGLLSRGGPTGQLCDMT